VQHSLILAVPKGIAALATAFSIGCHLLAKSSVPLVCEKLVQFCDALSEFFVLLGSAFGLSFWDRTQT
jgi:hypothetical protein